MVTYRRIMVGTDFSPLGGRAVEAGAILARRYKAERLHVVHIVPVTGLYDVIPPTYTEATHAEVQKNALERAQEHLEKLTSSVSLEAEVTCEARAGRPARQLAEVAKDIGADVIVIASHGRGTVVRAVLGSVASNLLRTSPCPVLVVRPEGPVLPEARQVLAAVDLSPVSEAVFRHAVGLATPTKATVRALSLCEPPLLGMDGEAIFPGVLGTHGIETLVKRDEKKLEALAARVQTEDVEVKTEVLRRAPPAEVILEVAELLRPEILVIGTSGRNAWHRFIVGATAARVVAEAVCPTFVVPSME